MLARLTTLLVLFVLAVPFAPAHADEYADAIKLFRGAGQSAKFFDRSYGYALFPTVGKGAVGLGGAYGSGRVYASHAKTLGGYQKGLAIFTVAKGGLMYEASVGGQKFSYTPK